MIIFKLVIAAKYTMKGEYFSMVIDHNFHPNIAPVSRFSGEKETFKRSHMMMPMSHFLTRHKGRWIFFFSQYGGPD